MLLRPRCDCPECCLDGVAEEGADRFCRIHCAGDVAFEWFALVADCGCDGCDGCVVLMANWMCCLAASDAPQLSANVILDAPGAQAPTLWAFIPLKKVFVGSEFGVITEA